MKISELIKELEEIKNKNGDLRVTIYDEYLANEGWDYEYQDLWKNVHPCVEFIDDEEGEPVEEVVCLR